MPSVVKKLNYSAIYLNVGCNEIKKKQFLTLKHNKNKRKVVCNRNKDFKTRKQTGS